MAVKYIDCTDEVATFDDGERGQLKLKPATMLKLMMAYAPSLKARKSPETLASDNYQLCTQMAHAIRGYGCRYSCKEYRRAIFHQRS